MAAMLLEGYNPQHSIIALEKLVKDKLFKRMMDLMKNQRGSNIFSEWHVKGVTHVVTEDDHGHFTVCSDSY